VKSVGEGVSKLRVGQRVVPFVTGGDKHTVAGNGSWQDEVVISADACFPVPDDVSDDAAAQVSGCRGTVRGGVERSARLLAQHAAARTVGQPDAVWLGCGLLPAYLVASRRNYCGAASSQSTPL